jgi:hypothetical protein
VSANALIVSVFVVLVLAAVTARLVIGPISGVAGDDSAYALAKIGAAPHAMAEQVEMARSDMRAGD